MAKFKKLDAWNMTNDETKDAVRELFRYTEQQEKKYSEADKRITKMQQAEMPKVRAAGLDDLPLWLR